MKKVSKRLFALVLALTMILSALVGCASSPQESPSTPDPAPAPSEGSTPEPSAVEQTLKLANIPEDAGDKTEDPWKNPGGVAFSAMYRTLVKAEANLTDVKPDMADYTISEDGLVYTFTLKDGLKWSDGEDITADDVAFSIYTLPKATVGNAIFISAFDNIKGMAAYRDGTSTEIEGIQVDGNTITITLESPYGAFLPVVAQFVILPEHAVKDIDPLELSTHSYWSAPVTSGAFKVGEMSPGNYYTLVPNEYYNGTPWKITKIINYFVPDLITAAQAGNLDYFSTNSVDVINEVSKLDYMEMYPVDILYYRYFACNISGVDGNVNPYMQDARVREAILCAIDRETITSQLLSGLGNVLHSGIPDSYSDNNGVKYDYNPERARQLLEEANYDFDHTLRIMYRYTDQTSIDFLDAVVYYLGEVGIKAETVYTQQAATDFWQTRNYDIAYMGLSAFSLSEWYGQYLSSNAYFNTIFGGDTQFDELTAKLSAEVDSAKRSEYLLQLQDMEQAAMYKLPLFTLGNNVFVNKQHVKIPDGVTFGNPWYLYDADMENWEIVG